MGVFLCARVNRRTEKGVFVFEILGGPFKFSLKVYRAITALLPCSLCVEWLVYEDIDTSYVCYASWGGTLPFLTGFGL